MFGLTSSARSGRRPGRAGIVAANPAPTDIALSASTIADDAAADDVVGTLSVTDPGESSWSWSITNGNTKFTLSASTGATVQLRRSAVGTLTAGVNETVEITVTDAALNERVESFTISVFDPDASQTYEIGVLDTLASGARTNVPFMAGVPLKTGFVAGATDAAGNTLTAGAQAIGVSSRCTDRSGKLSFAVVGGVLANLSSGGTATVTVQTAAGSDPSGTSITWADVLAATNHSAQGWNCTVEVDSSSVTYTADPRTMATSDTTYAHGDPHFVGMIADTPYFAGWEFTVPVKDGSNNRLHDKLRARYYVYAWKAGSGAVGGGNPILAIRADVELEMASWSDAISSPSASAIRVKNHAGSTVVTHTGSPTFTLHAYAASDLDVRTGVWWSNTADERGGTEIIPEAVSGRLEKIVTNGWALPSSHTAALLGSTLTNANTNWDAQSQLPFNFRAEHVTAQGSTGPRLEIAPIHSVEQYAWASWTTATHRAIARRNFSGALTQPLRYVVSGLPLDAEGAQASHTRASNKPTPSPTYLVTLDQGHQPFDGYMLYLIYGHAKYLKHMQACAQDCWAWEQNGSGLTKRVFTGNQVRGCAWAMRSVAMTAAVTPDDYQATRGWTRARLTTLLDNLSGTAGGTSSFGCYHGLKNEFWDASQTDAIPLSGRYDNDDSDNARWLSYASASAGPSFMWHYMSLALAWTRRLDIWNADGVSWIDWWAEGTRRWLVHPQRQWIADHPNGIIAASNTITGGPKNWNQVSRGWGANIQAAGFGQVILRGDSIPGATGYSLDVSTPSAATLTILGASALNFFNDGEASNGDWFKGTGAWNDGNGGLWIAGVSTNWAGRITAVASDGKSCTVDLTVTNGINPGSNVTNQSPSSVRMPPPGPNSSWINSATLIWSGFSNDYTSLALAALYAWNDAGYDLSAAETWLRARYVARGGNLPATSSDNQQWLFGAGWSS